MPRRPAPDVSYVRVRVEGETLIVAADRATKLFGDDVEVLGRLRGSELVGRQYRGPIFALGDREPGPYPVIAGDFVTTEDGTGIVHIAPAFGRGRLQRGADRRAVRCHKSSHPLQPGLPDGTYDERVTGYEGRHVKDPQLAADLTADLRERGLLLREEDYEHSYPHCWRCGTPLIYYAKPLVVHRDLAPARPHARREREDQLAPAGDQGWALRQLARQQRRLGAVARALLGNAAADLALRERARQVHRFVRRARAAQRQTLLLTHTGRMSTS
jgi:hypothetical protein